MRLVNRIENQPRPNLLFAAVQFLLMEDPTHDLARFYPNMTDNARPSREADPLFKTFVLANEDKIVEIGHNRYTQTNECRRCAVLLPAIMRAPYRSFHLVDLGTSAGLNLALDKYRYQWGDVGWGPDSQLVLKAESRGQPIDIHDIEILTRTGLDLNPIDPTIPEERLWLEALIWPEHSERRERLRTALDMASAVKSNLISGDLLEVLPGLLAELPADEPVVVMNSFVLIQLTSEQRQVLDRIIEDARSQRSVFRVSFEVMVKANAWGTVGVDDGSGMAEIGQAHPHGEWIELYARP